MKTIIIIGLLAIIMALTNPTKAEYVEWVTTEMKKQSDNFLTDWGIDYFAPNHIDKNTTVEDYVIFTVYKTNFDEETVTTLAIFKNFFPLPINTSSESTLISPKSKDTLIINN
jgi:hypothetical protein